MFKLSASIYSVYQALFTSIISPRMSVLTTPEFILGGLSEDNLTGAPRGKLCYHVYSTIM